MKERTGLKDAGSAFLNLALNIQVPQKKGNLFFTIWVATSFSKKILHYLFS
jgi:hypothetical protein